MRRPLSIGFVVPYGEPSPGFFPDTLLAELASQAREAGHTARIVHVYYDGKDPARDAEVGARLERWLGEAEADLATKDPYAFSIQVSDILRLYVSLQFNVHATEQTSPEFLAAADRRFDKLDTKQLGYLTLDTLPKTPAEQMASGKYKQNRDDERQRKAQQPF